MEEGRSCQSGHCYSQINSFHQPLTCPPEGPKSSTKTRWKGNTLLPALRAVWLLYSPFQEGWICLPLNSVLTARPRGALASKSPGSLGCPASPVMFPPPRRPCQENMGCSIHMQRERKVSQRAQSITEDWQMSSRGRGEYNRLPSSPMEPKGRSWWESKGP